jgi:YaiO family outer membrane protein
MGFLKHKRKMMFKTMHRILISSRSGGAAVIVWMTALCALATLPGIARAADGDLEPPTTKFIEGGADFTHFTNDVGDGNNQFLRFSLSKLWSYQLRFDVSRAQRFGDEGVGIGAAFSSYFAKSWSTAIGVSTGSGDFIFPRYRLDISFAYTLLPAGNLRATIGYVTEQSKGENSYDRIAASLTWYAGAHWIIGGYFNYDIGQPGDTITKSGGVGVTWYTWQKRFIGAVAEYGDVNYTQVGVTDFLVAYEQVWVRGYYTEYFNPTLGLNLRADWGTNKFYDFYGISASVFKSW